MPTMFEHAAKLEAAILRMVAEHGEDNTFTFAELHSAGGPSPLIAGRVASDLFTPWRDCGDVRVSIEGGRVVVAKREAKPRYFVAHDHAAGRWVVKHTHYPSEQYGRFATSGEAQEESDKRNRFTVGSGG